MAENYARLESLLREAYNALASQGLDTSETYIAYLTLRSLRIAEDDLPLACPSDLFGYPIELYLGSSTCPMDPIPFFPLWTPFSLANGPVVDAAPGFGPSLWEIPGDVVGAVGHQAGMVVVSVIDFGFLIVGNIIEGGLVTFMGPAGGGSYQYGTVMDQIWPSENYWQSQTQIPGDVKPPSHIGEETVGGVGGFFGALGGIGYHLGEGLKRALPWNYPVLDESGYQQPSWVPFGWAFYD